MEDIPAATDVPAPPPPAVEAVSSATTAQQDPSLPQPSPDAQQPPQASPTGHQASPPPPQPPVADAFIELPTPAAAMDTAAGNQQSTDQPASPMSEMLSDDELLTAQEETTRLPTEAKVLAIQNHTVVVPSYASWFSFTQIHDIERKGLPEFFNERNKSKTPQVYKDYRDFIINTYRLNPMEYLTITACRRNLAGDVCSIIRVHNFLEQWGLINYQVDADSKPIVIGPSYTGHFRITADTPRGFQPLGPNVPYTAREASSQNKGPVPPTPLPTLPASILPSQTVPKKRSADETTDESAMDTTDPTATKKSKHSCRTCGVACDELYFASTKVKEMVLCRNCFVDGRYPSSVNPADFARRDERDQSLLYGDGAAWSDQEMLLLLEGLEMFGENWERIAEHVGTRTKDQCILQFLDIPIEDPFLEEAGGKLGPLQYAMFPFSAADNPVLSVVAMLSSMVKPEVAKASAKAATEALIGAYAKEEEKMEAPVEKVEADEAVPDKKAEEEGTPPTAALTSSEAPVAAPPAPSEPESSAAPPSSSEPEPAAPLAPVEDTMEVDEKDTSEKPVEPAKSETPAPPTTKTESVKAEPPAEEEVEKANGSIVTALESAVGQDGSKVPRTEKLAATALGAAAARAFTIAHTQEEECRRLVERVVELQLQKLAIKMQYFAEIEAVVDAEREDLGRQRKLLAVERTAFRKEKAAFYAARAAGGAGAAGGEHMAVPMVTGGTGLETVKVQEVEVSAEDKESMGSNVIYSVG
ncbi:hypothetical protein HDU67_008559 [Dinochytrium kinnereticum]|nr:hypothetical protein HDU67_008559 [Dinochytrium kinnereticum]